MYNHNKAQQSKNRVHTSWDILYVSNDGANNPIKIAVPYLFSCDCDNNVILTWLDLTEWNTGLSDMSNGTNFSVMTFRDPSESR